MNLGSVANALNVGGVVGNLVGGVNVGGGSTEGAISTTYAQRVISVPPKAKVSLEAQYLFGDEPNTIFEDGLFYTRSLFLVAYFPKEQFKNGTHYIYPENNSPIELSAIISYSFSENCANERMLPVNMYLKDVVGVRLKGLYKMKYQGELNVAPDLFVIWSNSQESKTGGFPLP